MDAGCGGSGMPAWPGRSMLAGAAEAAGATLRRAEIFDDVEAGLHDRNDDQLRESFERIAA